MLMANVGKGFLLFDHGRGLLPLSLEKKSAASCSGDQLRSQQHDKIRIAVHFAEQGCHSQHTSSTAALSKSKTSTMLRWLKTPSIPVALADLAVDAYVALLADRDRSLRSIRTI